MFEVDSVEAVQVRFVAVVVPPASLVRNGAADDPRCRVSVFGGEDAVVVETERVTWRHGNESRKKKTK